MAKTQPMKSENFKHLKSNSKKKNNELKEVELAIPIHGIETDNVISFGEVKISPPDKVKWELFGPSFTTKKGKEKLLESYKKEGLTATALVSVRAYRKDAFLKAYSKLERVFTILTFFNIEIGKGNQIRGKVYMDIEGRAQLGFCNWYVRRLDGTSTGFGSKSVGLYYFNDLIIDNDKFQLFTKSRIGKRIINILYKKGKERNDMEKRIVKSLIWHRQALSQIEPYQQFGFLYIALEVLLYPSQKELTVVKCDDKKCKKGLWNFPKQEEEFRRRIKTLIKKESDTNIKYAIARIMCSSRKKESLKKIRNGIFHSGFTGVDSEDVTDLKIAYEAVLLSLLNRLKLPISPSGL